VNDDKPRRLTFDPTINAGHILTFAGMLVTVFIAYSTLDKRVVVLEESKQYQRLRDEQQDNLTTHQLAEIKAAIAEIKIGVNELRRERKP
jgi:UDP-N-acetylglucosamine transferase subunit ALG13